MVSKPSDAVTMGWEWKEGEEKYQRKKVENT
jgi:hypothetical protein